MSEVPNKLQIVESSSITNREWLWLEDSCGVNATTASQHPMRLMMALKALTIRRWEAAQGRPPKVTFGDVVDGTYDYVEFVPAEGDEDEGEEAEGNPTAADEAA